MKSMKPMFIGALMALTLMSGRTQKTRPEIFRREDYRLPGYAFEKAFEPDPERYEPSLLYSEKYETNLPSELIKAGIEKVDKKTGEALIAMYCHQKFVKYQHEQAGSYRGLDIQDRIFELNKGLEESVNAVDIGKLTQKLGKDNLLVKIAAEAEKSYQSTVGRKSNFEELLDQNPKDTMAALNRFYG